MEIQFESLFITIRFVSGNLRTMRLHDYEKEDEGTWPAGWPDLRDIEA